LNRLTVSGSIAYTTGIVIMTNAPNSPTEYAALVMNLAMPSITVAFVITMKIVQTAAIEIRLIAIFETIFETICGGLPGLPGLLDSINSGTSVDSFGVGVGEWEDERDDSGDDSGEMIACILVITGDLSYNIYRSRSFRFNFFIILYFKWLMMLLHEGCTKV